MMDGWSGGGASGLLMMGRRGRSILSIKDLSLKGVGSRSEKKSDTQNRIDQNSIKKIFFVMDYDMTGCPHIQACCSWLEPVVGVCAQALLPA